MTPWRMLILSWLMLQTAAGLTAGAWFALLHPVCRDHMLDAYRATAHWADALRACRMVDSDNIWWTVLIQEYLL